MAIILHENQYRGVNAHLHSHFQHDATNAWGEFHHAYLFLAAEKLNRQLPPRYRVRLERSLQIREYNPTTGERIRRPIPDITLYDSHPSTISSASSTPALAAPTVIFPAIETLQEQDEDYLRALVIHDKDMGKPITRIELLSPTNKPPGRGAFEYIGKRETALWSGMALVEIDYLHETRSPIRGIAPYPEEPDSYPYTIVVTDPHPSLAKGEARVYGFRIDDPIPTIPIPLVEEDTLNFDFGAEYMRTFSSLGSFYEAVDYEQLPVAIETYALIDRERIDQVCQRVKEKIQ